MDDKIKNEKQLSEIEYGKDVCGMTVPFQGEALHPFENSYARATGEISYLAMENSAIMCSGPLKYTDYYLKNVTVPGYECVPDEKRGPDELPFTYAGW